MTANEKGRPKGLQRRRTFDGGERDQQMLSPRQQAAVADLWASMPSSTGSNVNVLTTQKPGRDWRDRKKNGAHGPDHYLDAFRRLSASNRKQSSSPDITCTNDDDEMSNIHGADYPDRNSPQCNFRLPFEPNNNYGNPEVPFSFKKSHSDSCAPLPPPPPSRSSRLPRRNVYSKGIDVRNLQPPPPRRAQHGAHSSQAASVTESSAATSQQSPPSATPLLFSESSCQDALKSPTTELRRHAKSLSPNSPGNNTGDAAAIQLKELCTSIIRSGREGVSPPSRSEIKEAVAEYKVRSSQGSAGAENTSALAQQQSPPSARPLFDGVYRSLIAPTKSATSSKQQSAQISPNSPDRSMRDVATIQLQELCKSIIRSGREGVPPPSRSEIKEVVAAYHRSHRYANSSPDSTAIPAEYAEVLTYGLARSQKAPASRSKFSEIKDEWTLLDSTITLDAHDDTVSCVTFQTFDHSLD
jgi:hypothetical protein